MLGSDFAQASSAQKDLNLARGVGEAVTQTEQNRDVLPHDSSTETARPSFGNGRFLFDAGQLY
jgi:hypothetical protein